jgi:hypothetical protein
MVAVPAETPVMEPVVLTAVATAVLLLLQVPPVDVLVRVMLFPTQKATFPPIAAGFALILTTVVTVPQLLV